MQTKFFPLSVGMICAYKEFFSKFQNTNLLCESLLETKSKTANNFPVISLVKEVRPFIDCDYGPFFFAFWWI